MTVQLAIPSASHDLSASGDLLWRDAAAQTDGVMELPSVRRIRIEDVEALVALND